LARSKSEETRARLVDAAFALFSERGYNQVTVDQIATAAGVSRRTFFRHFSAKEEVVFPYTRQRRAAFHGAVRARTGGSPASIQILVDVYREIAKAWMNDKAGMLRNQAIVAQSESLLAFDYDIDSKWKYAIAVEIDGIEPSESHAIDKCSLRARIIADVVVSAVRPVFTRWYELDGAFDLVEAGDYALAAAVGGVGDLGEELNKVVGDA